LKSLFTLLISILLSGCASQYVAPVGAETVEVTYSTTVSKYKDSGLSVFIFPSLDCGEAKFAGALHLKDKNQVSFNIDIEANKILVSTFRIPIFYGGMLDYYFISTAFTPKAGNSYEVAFIYPSGVEVFNISSGKRERETSLIQPKKVCTF